MAFPVITPIPNAPTKPDADSTLWNTRYLEIDANFDILENAVSNEFWDGTTFSVPPGTGDVNGHVINNEGSPLAQKVDLDFIGASVVASTGGSATEVTINGAVLAKNIETLTGNKTLTDASEPIQALTPDADRDVDLPAEAVTNPYFVIENVTGSGFTLTVKDDSPATIDTVADGEVKIFFSDGVSWFVFAGGGGASPLTTKGDVFTYDTGDQRLPIGSNSLVLTADSGETTGMKWASPGVPLTIVGGRLTLTTGVPVTTADVLAATTLFYTPYKGNLTSVYDGTDWISLASAEISIAVPSTTTTMYDAFVYDNAGTLTLEALAWTNDTTRATALVYQDGVLVKSGDATRRYIGSFRTTGVSGQTEDSESTRFLWNYYNRIERFLECHDETDSWIYTTSTYRAANANTTVGVGRFELVVGVSEDLLVADNYTGTTNPTPGVNSGGGVGIDSTSSNSALSFGGNTQDDSIPFAMAKYKGYLAAGYHFIQRLEISAATGTTTHYGDSGAVTIQTGMTGSILM